jgi:hypothetical protein
MKSEVYCKTIMQNAAFDRMVQAAKGQAQRVAQPKQDSQAQDQQKTLVGNRG